MKKHTLVVHLLPDLEALFMLWLILFFKPVREALGVVAAPKLKFIPAGPLRAEDWPGLTPETSALEEAGYLFLDCGGGSLDQHGKTSGGVKNTVSSIELLVQASGLDQVSPHLMPLVDVIRENDLRGQDVARDTKYRQSSTPHTPRHLKNVILGWNLMFPDHPEKVVRQAHVAFTGMAELLKEGGSVNQLFLLSTINDGVKKTASATLAGYFEKSSGEALQVLEAEWEQAVSDYWRNCRFRPVRINTEVRGEKRVQTITLAWGFSDSERFSQVTRLGNDGPPHRRPFRGRKHRYKADVTIQFRDGGSRFIISTRGKKLNEVARKVREADLRRKGVQLTAEQVSALAEPGHRSFTDRADNRVEALYFAEFETCFGNAFRSNPHSVPTSLKPSEVVDLVFEALNQV